MSSKKNAGRGGARKGAGRKPMSQVEGDRATIYAPKDYLEYAELLGQGNLSEGFRHLVDFHRGKSKKT